MKRTSKTHGDKLVKVTVDTVNSKPELRESFINVVATRFSYPEELNSSAV